MIGSRRPDASTIMLGVTIAALVAIGVLVLLVA